MIHIKYRRFVRFATVLIFLVSIHLNASSLKQTQSQLLHFPVKTGIEGQSIRLELKMEDAKIKPDDAKIYFRIKGASNYQYIEMTEEADGFSGVIPGRAVKAPAIEYFLAATLADKNIITSPASNPFYAPYEISIAKVSSGTTGTVTSMESSTGQKLKSSSGAILAALILSPEPQSNNNENEVVIAVSFVNEKGTMDPTSVKLFLNNENFTSKTRITPFLLTFTPQNLSRGNHQVKIEAKDMEGKSYETLEWQFMVESETVSEVEKKKSFDARVYFNAKSEKISDSTLTTLNSGANFAGKFGILDYRGSAFITSREKADQQPRNRFLFEVGTSWLGIRLGDTNPRFNDLILWGKRVRGIEGYLKFGFFNLEFVQGETNRAIDTKILSTQINTVTGDTTYNIREGTFGQNLLGIRPSFGSGKNFQIGFNLLKVKDEVHSINSGRNPKDNVVFGPDFLFALDNHRIEIKAGLAFSLLTNDISEGSISKDDIDQVFDTDIPFDPADIENIFVINTSTTPLDPRDLNSLAYNAQFNLNYFNNSINILYKNIGSEYNSLGNTFLRKNIKGFSAYDRIRLMQNQVHLTLGYEHYIDGLDEENDDNPNTEPTTLNTFNIGVAYYPRTLGIPKVNLNFKEHNRTNGIDSLYAVDNKTQDVSVQLSYDVKVLNLDNIISLSIIGSDRVDDYNPETSNISADIRMLTLRTKYTFPLTTILTIATNQTKAGENLNAFSFKYNQYGIDGYYYLLDQKLKINSGINLTSGEGAKPSESGIVENYTDYTRFSYNLGGSYQITAKQLVSCDLFVIRFDDKKASAYDDSIIRLRYELRY